MPLRKLPTTIDVCCNCIPDLKAATAIIAVLAIVCIILIVTSPVMAWAIVRHSYVIRVSCVVSSSSEQADVLDISLNNVISFGFGANAGLSPSCLKGKKTTSDSVREQNRSTGNEKAQNGSTNISVGLMSSNQILEHEAMAESPNSNSFVKTAKIMGWLVLLADVSLTVISIILLNFIFQVNNNKKNKMTLAFMYSLLISIILSFLYGIFHVVTCVVAGGSFPIFEFMFTCFDLGLWIYFLIVVNSYRHTIKTSLPQQNQENRGIPQTL